MPTRYVTYTAVEGLANRLRTHFIAHAYALHTRSCLILNWSLVKACGARFHELFDAAGIGATGQSFPYSILLQLLSRRPIRFNGAQPSDINDVTDLPIPRYGLIEFGEAFSPFGHEHDGQMLGQYRDEVIAALRPRPDIQARIDAVARQFVPPVVGVHIRRGDFSVSFPGRMLPLDFYQSVLRAIVAAEPETLFFISADEQDYIMPLRIEFRTLIQPRLPRQSQVDPLALFEYPNKCNRDTLQGVREAVTDLFTLARTDVVLGTRNSSFSEVAAFLGRIPAVFPDDATPLSATACAAQVLSVLHCRRRPREYLITGGG